MAEVLLRATVLGERGNIRSSAQGECNGGPASRRTPLFLLFLFFPVGSLSVPGRISPILVVKVVFTNPQQDHGPSFPFELAGESPDPHDPGATLEFSGEGLGSGTGAYMEDEVVAFNLMPWALPQRVSNSTRTFSWKVRSGSGWTDLDETSNPFWVTWGAPWGSSTTAKRVDWVTEKANGCENVPEIADAVWSALQETEAPPLEPWDGTGLTTTGEWKLLDGEPWAGMCNNQASLMHNCLKMLGVNSALGMVFASWDADMQGPDRRALGQAIQAQVCYAPSHFARPGDQFEYLGIRIPGHPEPHAFLGFCLVSGTYYCLLPPGKSDTPLGLQRNCVQENNGVLAWHYWYFDESEQEWIMKPCASHPLP